MNGMKPATVHTLENEQVPTTIDDRHGDRNIQIPSFIDGSLEHSLGSSRGQALCRRERHRSLQVQSKVYFIFLNLIHRHIK
jgi:hypothetical protein